MNAFLFSFRLSPLHVWNLIVLELHVAITFLKKVHEACTLCWQWDVKVYNIAQCNVTSNHVNTIMPMTFPTVVQCWTGGLDWLAVKMQNLQPVTLCLILI